MYRSLFVITTLPTFVFLRIERRKWNRSKDLFHLLDSTLRNIVTSTRHLQFFIEASFSQTSVKFPFFLNKIYYISITLKTVCIDDLTNDKYLLLLIQREFYNPHRSITDQPRRVQSEGAGSSSIEGRESDERYPAPWPQVRKIRGRYCPSGTCKANRLVGERETRLFTCGHRETRV